MRGQEFGQPRNDHVAGDRVGQVDAQAAAQAAGRRLEHPLQLLGVGQQVVAALEELLAVRSEPHAPRGPLQQARADLRFELPDRHGHTAFREAELVGGAREAGQLRNAGKDAERVEFHFSIVLAARTVWSVPATLSAPGEYLK